MKKVDRRDALKYLGLGILAAGSAPLLGARRAAAEARPARVPRAVPPATVAHGATVAGDALAPVATRAPLDNAPHVAATGVLAPLAVGSSLAGSQIVRIDGPNHGAIHVDLRASDGHLFRVEICRHDGAGPAPVTRTRHYDLFLANGGRGDRRTDRAEGLAVIGLSWALRRNERRAQKLPVMTMRHRWARFRPTEISRADG